MLSSTVEQVKLTISDQVKRFGYTALTLALNQMLKNGQRKLVAMIIVALCLAPRKREVENRGILRVLRNIPLWRLGTADSEFMFELGNSMDTSGNYNKVVATLTATQWFMRGAAYWPNHKTPYFSKDDGCLLFNSQKDWDDRDGFQHMLCDHAGCQRDQYAPHFRFLMSEDGYYVRVIGRQLADRSWCGTRDSVNPLSNGYGEYLVPANTVLFHCSDELDGRTLADIMEPGVWYNYYFQPDTPLDLVDHVAEAQLAQAHQSIANLAMKFGQLNG